MNFKEEMTKKVEQIEEIIKKYLPKEEGYQKTIFEAMNYSILAGGKRLRPLLMQETAKLFGNVNENILHPFMAAMEMIHTYSLVHDDLPALDNDEYRRGKKTTWAVFGEDMGILAGDALLNYAYETAAKAFDHAKTLEEYQAVAKALQVLTTKPGVYGMIGGQVVDVEKSGQGMDIDLLNFVYMMKTSALIECSMMVGAILAGASLDQLKVIESIGRKTGLAFQIEDDILDVTSSLEVLGKPILSDEKNEKTTYVTLYGVEAAKAMAAQLSNEAVRDLVDLNAKDTFIYALILELVHREK